MPVTCDPALVARMLRNLRSPCKEQDDNRRSLVEAQRTGRAAIVIIGLRQNRPPSKNLEAAPTIGCGLAARTGESGRQMTTAQPRPRPAGCGYGSDPAGCRGPWSWTSW